MNSRGNVLALSIDPDNARAARFAIYRRKEKDWMPAAGKPFKKTLPSGTGSLQIRLL